MTEARDYYRVLQVDPDAEPEVIHAAYRRLAAKYHPDVSDSPEAADRMSEINAAYGVLKDPDQRAAYDRARGAAQASATSKAAGAGASTRGGAEGFVRALVLMVVSGIIINLIFSSVAGPNGRFFTIVAIVGLLLWKGGPIFRYFSGNK
jgi:DnaJ-class molecular chaperone